MSRSIFWQPGRQQSDGRRHLTNTASGTVQVGTSGGSLSAISAAGLNNAGTIDLFGNTSNSANQANLTVTGSASNSGTVNILSAGNLTVSGPGNSYGQTTGTTSLPTAL